MCNVFAGMIKGMNLILLVVAGFLIKADACAQNTITEQEWGSEIKLLQNEQWKQSEKLVSHLLKSVKQEADTSYDVANLRYMYLVSVAGQLANKEIDKPVALKKVKSLTGKVIITPGRVSKIDGMFNYFKINRDSAYIFCCQANNKATEIQIFETYKMRDSTDINYPLLYEGKTIRLKARIQKITAAGYLLPRFEVLFTDTSFYSVEEE